MNKHNAYDEWDRLHGSSEQWRTWGTSETSAPAAHRMGIELVGWWCAASTSCGSAWGTSPDSNESDYSDIKDGFWFFYVTIVIATYGIYCLWYFSTELVPPLPRETRV